MQRRACSRNHGAAESASASASEYIARRGADTSGATNRRAKSTDRTANQSAFRETRKDGTPLNGVERATAEPTDRRSRQTSAYDIPGGDTAKSRAFKPNSASEECPGPGEGFADRNDRGGDCCAYAHV